MNQALKLVAEINRKKKRILETRSSYLRNDLYKSIRSDMFELRDYCKFKGLDFKEVARFIE
jgi:hypothetical protein